MFIRTTKTGTAPDGSPRITHRLVENRRIDGKVRQRTLLNLGRHFAIGRDTWPLLCRRVVEIRTGQESFGFEQVDPEVEAEAQRIAGRLLADEAGADDSLHETVDVSSVCDRDGRSIGIEHAALTALELLGLPQLLDDLGFNRRQRCCALASIVARMAHPASERETARWLRSASAAGELLGIDLPALNDMALHRASDRLLAHQDRIEDHLFGTAQTLFDFAPTVTLYDLTTTWIQKLTLTGIIARRTGVAGR